MPHTEYIIMYSGCFIVWCGRLQTRITLSTAEAEYIALSQALRTFITLMTLIEELRDIFPLYINKPDFHCKLFEDNQTCIAMNESSKLSPRTKNIALKYHHFKYYVYSKRLRIIYTCSEYQIADILTKPLPDGQFNILKKVLNCW